MQLNEFLTQLRNAPESIHFSDTLQVIEKNYHYQPRAFRNGDLVNDAGQNEGSCKLFAFAIINRLSEQETLQCFGDYYRRDVVENPNGTDHGNIRNFQKYGWSGVNYEQLPLTAIRS